jgi:ceramide glucosyltransferase
LLWTILLIIAIVAIATQAFFIFFMRQNFRYALKKAKRKEHYFLPQVLLTVPCKGLDNSFEKNIASFYHLDYPAYDLNFVVESEQDPAYEQLCKIKEKLASTSNAKNVNILIAGLANTSSQKIHNLLCSTANATDSIEVFAFADSDACLKPDWLKHLVHPLRQQKIGASTGYRWFVPDRSNAATLALTVLNGKVAQLMGNTGFNQAWGGSMAIRVEDFKNLGVGTAWQTAVSDDLCLSYVVKKAGMKIVFCPGCLVPSYEHTTWPKLFEFARRQFLITRVSLPGVWLFGLFCSLYAIAGLWLGLAVAIAAAVTKQPYLPTFIAVPAIFLIGQIVRSILRQKMIANLLPEDAPKLKTSAVLDITANSILSWILLACILASAIGRTITWRGIKYKLLGPTKTQIIK